MSRLSDWQTRLSNYLNQAANTEFEYGVLDCGLFVADCIVAITGLDVASELRGYASRAEAFARIEALCGTPSMEAVAAYLAERYGFDEVPVGSAQRGDAVVIKRGRASSLGIIAMHGTEILTPYKDGIARLPLNLATHAYRI